MWKVIWDAVVLGREDQHSLRWESSWREQGASNHATGHSLPGLRSLLMGTWLCAGRQNAPAWSHLDTVFS